MAVFGRREPRAGRGKDIAGPGDPLVCDRVLDRREQAVADLFEGVEVLRMLNPKAPREKLLRQQCLESGLPPLLLVLRLRGSVLDRFRHSLDSAGPAAFDQGFWGSPWDGRLYPWISGRGHARGLLWPSFNFRRFPCRKFKQPCM